MTEKKSICPRFPYKKSFNAFSRADSPHSLAEVSTSPSPSEKRTEEPKTKKLRSRKHRGGKKNTWASHSCALALDSISPKQPSPRACRRWSFKPVPSEMAKSMSSFKHNDSSSFKHQAKGVFRRFFLSAKNTLVPKLTRRPSSTSWRSKSRSASDDPLSTPKPKISYPMKLHNSDLSFVTTQDPWEASVRSSGLHRRATVGTSQSHQRSIPCSESRFSSCQPSHEGKRLSFSIQQHVSRDSISNTNLCLKLQPEPMDRSTCTARPKSANQAKLSLEDTRSQRCQNHSFPPNRGSLYRHPSTRPLSLSHHSHRNSIMLSGDENMKRSNIDGTSRRSSMASSNLTSTTSQLRQSWTTGRAVLETSTPPPGSGLSCSERSSVINSGADQKSLSSYRRPARNDWAGVIEEDITLTLMGCPQSSPTTPSRASPAAVIKSIPPPMVTSSAPLPPAITSPTPSPVLAVPLPSPKNSFVEQMPPEDAPLERVPSEDASSIPPSADAPSTTTSSSASATFRSPGASATPPFLHSSPTPSSTPSPPPSIRSIPLHRPLSLLFQSMGSSHLDEIDSDSKHGSDWYAELMTTVEQSISKLN